MASLRYFRVGSNVRRVIVARVVFVTRNNPGRLQGFDDVERVKLGVEASTGGLGEVLVEEFYKIIGLPFRYAGGGFDLSTTPKQNWEKLSES